MTPYLHALVYHVPQFLEMYKTIYQFNCQLVEKKNHAHTSYFHRGTQKGGRCSSHSKQILQRENRKLFCTCEKIWHLANTRQRKDIHDAKRREMAEKQRLHSESMAVRMATVAWRKAKKTSRAKAAR